LESLPQITPLLPQITSTISQRVGTRSDSLSHIDNEEYIKKWLEKIGYHQAIILESQPTEWDSLHYDRIKSTEKLGLSSIESNMKK